MNIPWQPAEQKRLHERAEVNGFALVLCEIEDEDDTWVEWSIQKRTGKTLINACGSAPDEATARKRVADALTMAQKWEKA